ncbi:MAG: S8 family serine peptidase [Firmicutes bacterium]|nr:S8 family serine peptidase [Bacillota bacterium]
MKNKILKIISLVLILFGLTLFFAIQGQSSDLDMMKVEVIYAVSDESQAYQIEELHQIKLISISEYGFAVYEANDHQLNILEDQGFELNNTHETTLPPWNPPVTDSDPYINDQYALDMLNVHEAWLETTGSIEVLIAIIDTGIDTDHDEFLNRISPLSYNSRTKQVGISYVEDDNGHGTLVAGVIGANKDNSKGIAGIVQNSQILVIKANNLEDPLTEEIESKSFTDASIIEGIYYAADQGAQVINMSLGSSSANTLMQQAINYARNLGVILVAASGNDGVSSKFYPASFDGVISVSAVNENETIWEQSNYNDKVDISAPGSLILSTSLNNGYATASGTSLAAPQVSGVIGLMLAYFTEFDSNQIIQQLLSSAVDKGTIGYDVYFGEGIVNAAAALNVEYITVTFDTNGGDLMDPILVVKDYVFLLENPTKNGFEFQGWYRDALFTDQFQVGVDTSSVDLTLYAKFIASVYQVNFITSGTEVNSIYVSYGQSFEIPETSKTGYNFNGWYLDDSFLSSYNGEAVLDNITLYAKFTIITYTINYYIGLEIDSSIQVDYGNTFTPMTPEYEYPFINWYLDPDFVNLYENGAVYSNINLYARFDDGQYTIVFYGSDQTSVILTTFAYYGEEVTPPNEPTKPSSPSFDYTFEGWSSEITNVTQDISYYPIFTKVFKKESVYLLPSLDTISSLDVWVDGGLYEIDPILTYEVRVLEDEDQLGRYFVYYDLYSENEWLETRVRVLNVIADNPIEITLNPDVTTILVGTRYNDQGIETNLGTISKTGTVDTNVSGIYTIVYTVTYDEYSLTKTKYIYVLESDDLYDTTTLYHKKEEEGLFI